MPKIVVEGPDGRKFAFPDTMPRAEINAFMKQKYGTKARNETVQDYLARVVREEEATKARAKDIDVKATAAGRAEGERAAERMGVTNPLMMAVAAPAIGLAQQSAARDVYNREGTVLADEAAGLSAINAAGFFVPGMVNREFGARVEEGRRQQPLAAFAGDIAGGFGPGEIIGAGVAKAAQAVGPSMAALGRMFSGQKISPEMQATLQQTAMGSIGGSAYGNFNDVNQDGVIDQRDVYAGAVAGGVGLPATVKGAQVAGDFMPAPRSAPRVAPDAMPAGGYFGRQSMRPPGSGPSAREIETQQLWATATPIVTQARTTAQSAQQAADAALQSKAPADIARAKDQKKALVGQLQEAQASRAGMDTPEDARLAETLASLAENTSDPVLLSTQISAAKTSLDRLLTDIGSPVEGNLIPVKTNILTRTQAPRSAAEGPQDRASVTRYAAGTDEVKPQGFGTGGPKKPEQGAPKALLPPEQGRVRLFNVGTSDRDPGKYLQPHVSDWVNEVASGAGDFDDLSEITKPLIYLSDEPEKWLPMIVGRKIGKHPTEVTLDDIRQHGRLNVVDADPEYDTIYKVGDFSSDEKVTRLDGERVKWWETDLYDSDDFREMPVGPEPNDFISREAAEISQSLTGDDLVEFMRASGFKDPAAKAPPLKPMGFGASPPKTPQQAARFETPGSPEYEAAVAKGLDMSQAGRMGRAKEQGFDTENVFYHGTTKTDLTQLNRLHGARSKKLEYFGEDRGMNSLGIWVSNRADEHGAEMYAKKFGHQGGIIMPLLVRAKKPYVIQGSATPGAGQDKAFEEFYDFIRKLTPNETGHPSMRDMRPVRKWLKENGYDSVILKNTFGDSAGFEKTAQDMLIVLDDGNIRSVNAAFDPEKSTSSTLLAAAPFAAVGGAGLTSERELGSKMKRDKKD